MLKDIYSNSRHVKVGPTGSSIGYFSTEEPNRAVAGDVYYDSNSYGLKVFDGNYWHDLGDHTNIEMDTDADLALDWAIKKMKQEQEWDSIAATNIAVQKAYDNYKKAEEQLRVIVELSRGAEPNVPVEEDDLDDIPF